MKSRDYVRKLLEFMRVRPAVGGLEISDSVLRFAAWTGNKWINASLRLPPGIVEGGKVKDRAQFLNALQELYSQVAGSKKGRRKIGAVVSLGSVDIYSQTFSLPVIEGENLEKAIDLNIQMASPIAAADTYSGWQMIGEDKTAVRLEVLSAFINRQVVDDLVSVLRDAKFVPHSLEPRGLSLARVIRELGEGFDRERPYIVLGLDESGLELLVIRKAQLYFQYFTSWADIYGGEKQISQEAFEAALVRSLHQVVNFYRSHWQEPLSDIYLVAPGLKEQVAKIVSDNFSLNVLELQLKGIPATPDWFVALGAALRGVVPPGKDRDMSLLGISAREEFRREQILNFLGFWRVLMPASLGILLAAFILAETFLIRLNKNLDATLAANVQSDRSAEIRDLQERAEEFNRAIALIQSAMGQSRSRFQAVGEVNGLLRTREITLLRFQDQGSGSAITLNGRARTESDIRSFAEDLGGEGEFQNVNLPLSEIRSSPDGVQFSISFNFVAVSAE